MPHANSSHRDETIRSPANGIAPRIMRIIYVSDSNISSSGAQEELTRLVEQARCRNLSQGISGSLLFSGKHFAQLLEGSNVAVRELMHSILADPRHQNIQIILEEMVEERCLPNWGLGYAGPSIYVSKAIQRAGRDAAKGKRGGAEILKRMIVEFASP